MIKAIIGLGNPGRAYCFTRHNIGFRVVDAIADRLSASWREAQDMEIAQAVYNERTLYLIKPQTFMNSSGKVMPFLLRKGIKPEEVLVIHDELELPFGKIAYKVGGSAKGHNGLKSIIAACGPDFARVRCGIDRPENREQVPDYVLAPFKEGDHAVEAMINAAAQLTFDHLT